MMKIFGAWWCRHFHRRTLRPFCGQYICAVCLRKWPVPWEVEENNVAVLRAAPIRLPQTVVGSR
jgi:hypothetical protein